MHLEKENSEIMKQLIMISSEMNSANARCTDMQFLLEMRAKERMTEMQQKRDLTMKLENLLLHYKEEVIDCRNIKFMFFVLIFSTM